MFLKLREKGTAFAMKINRSSPGEPRGYFDKIEDSRIFQGGKVPADMKGAVKGGAGVFTKPLAFEGLKGNFSHGEPCFGESLFTARDCCRWPKNGERTPSAH
jgi:hypothetical protein